MGTNQHHHRTSASRTTIAVIALVAILGLTIPAGADAGTYVINDCPAAQAGDYSVGLWSQFGSIPGPGGFKQTCAVPGESFGIVSNELFSNGTAGEELQAPPSITMQHVKLWWEAPAPSASAGGGWSYAQVEAYSPGWSRVYDSTTPLLAGGSGQPPSEIALPTSTSRLLLDIYCTNSQNCGYTQNPLQIFGVQLMLSDSGLPKGSVTGGGLAGTGPLSGTQSLSYDAEDAGSGVRLAELLLDGQSVAKEDYIAECPYQSFAACPTSVSSLITWDTKSASDGAHEVALRIVNAAGNATILDGHTITIANPSTVSTATVIGPGSPAAERGTANGTNASDQAELSARWMDARGAKAAKATLTSRYGADERLVGSLETSMGQPISGALLDVSETPAYQGAKTMPLAGVRTGPTGEWTLTLPRDISSSTLRFAYRSHIDDTVPAATTMLTLRVHAGIALLVEPHVTSVGHSIYFSGVVHGAPIPPGGKQLVLEASSGGEWIEFHTIRTDSRGRYRASYRFKFSGPVTYRFRATSRYEADFPYLDGSSNVVGVYER